MRYVALVVVLLLGSACHTMRFEVSGQPAAEVVHERKAFFLWGLVPNREIDAGERCPHGVAAIQEDTTFLDGFFGVVTLGIYQPRSSTYHCLAPGGSP